MKKTIAIILIMCVMMALTFTLLGCGDDSDSKSCSHTWSDWEVVKAATCTESGKNKRKCSNCGETEERTIPAVGHNFVDGICTDCGASE